MMRQEVRRCKEMERKWGERRGCEIEVSNELKNSYFQFPNMGITRIAQSQHMHTNFHDMSALSPLWHWCFPLHWLRTTVCQSGLQTYEHLPSGLPFSQDNCSCFPLRCKMCEGQGIYRYRCMRSDVCMSKTNSSFKTHSYWVLLSFPVNHSTWKTFWQPINSLSAQTDNFPLFPTLLTPLLHEYLFLCSSFIPLHKYLLHIPSLTTILLPPPVH